MKKFVVLLFTTFVLVGMVGPAGEMSFSAGNDWSSHEEINFDPELSYRVTSLANNRDLPHVATVRTNEVFGSGTGGEPGGILGRSFSDISYSRDGIVSSGPFDNLGGRQRIKKINNPRDTVPVAPVSEPTTILLIGIGMVGLAQVARIKFKL